MRITNVQSFLKADEKIPEPGRPIIFCKPSYSGNGVYTCYRGLYFNKKFLWEGMEVIGVTLWKYDDKRRK